jgi:hypothetical protein
VRQKNPLHITRVRTPEWGNKGDFVHVRMFAADEADDVRRLCQMAADDKVTEAKAFAAWCVFSVCNEQGEHLFTERDIPALLKKPLAPLQRCAIEAMKVNGITLDGAARKKN